MLYPVALYPNHLLETVCTPVEEITDELIQLLDDMRETMRAHDGIGLAAPQIGKKICVAVIEVDEETGLFELINPEIIQYEGSSIDVEGCLSLPNVYGTVERFDTIVVRYFDREGTDLEIEVFGYLARAFQHEIDHLNGVLFTQKIKDRIAVEDLDKYMEEH